MGAFKFFDKKVASWIKYKQLGKIERPIIPVETFSLPEIDLTQIKNVPKLFSSIKKLEVINDLGYSASALSSLIFLMDRKDAISVYNKLAILIVNVTIDKDLAQLWFVSCHKIPPPLMAISVLGFFELSELHQQGVFNEKLKDILAGWFKLLSKSYSQYSKVTIENTLKVAQIFPKRFLFTCYQLTINNYDEFNSLGNFLQKIPDTSIDLASYELLLEFTLETGCFLNDEEFDQIWKIAFFFNFKIIERLKVGFVPISSIRFLAGLLKGIGDKQAIEDSLLKERIQKLEQLFNCNSEKYIKQLFLNYPELVDLLNKEIIFDFIITAISCKVTAGDQFLIGYLISIQINKTPGGISFHKINKFIQLVDNKIIGNTVFFISNLYKELSKNQSFSMSNFVRLYQIINRALPIAKEDDKSKIKNIFRTLVKQKHKEAKNALIELKKAVYFSNVPLGSILASLILILRTSNKHNREEYLSRIILTGKLLNSFTVSDRKKIVKVLSPAWIELLFSHPVQVEETVVEHIYEVNSLDLRKRYLEVVVTRLVAEVNPSGQMFKECLAYAITGYNLTDSLDKIRITEHELFTKAHEADDRGLVVDKVMNDLLSMPGFEGNKSEEILLSIRLLCNSFSRLAVWGERGNLLFQEFIGYGVNSILRAFVDTPQVTEVLDKNLLATLIYRFIPEELDTKESSVMLYSGETAVIFFGKVLPLAITLFDRKIELLPEFLLKLSEEFSRSLGGMIADKEFALCVLDKLEIELSQEKVVCLSAWLAQKTPLPFSMDNNWAVNIRNEWNDNKVLGESIQMKLLSLISSVVGPMSNTIRDSLLKLSSNLAKHINKADFNEETLLSLAWDRDKLQQLTGLLQGSSLFELIAQHNNNTSLVINKEIYNLLELEEGFMVADIFHAWRQNVFPQLFNCILEIYLASERSFEKASNLLDIAMKGVEFLGYASVSTLLSTLQESVRNTTNSDVAINRIEKKFLAPLWIRNYSPRINLLILGMEAKREILNTIIKRLSIIDNVKDKIEFMRDFANLFLTVENSLLSINSVFEKKKIADTLVTSWVFGGEGKRKPWFLAEIFETVELVQDVFTRIKYGSGIVTANEASDISIGMRKKYRDNADSVAIILKWTIDPAREGLLQLLEESQMLLQAAGSDSELMRLLDLHGAREGFLLEAAAYSENPQALKNYLYSLTKNKV